MRHSSIINSLGQRCLLAASLTLLITPAITEAATLSQIGISSDKNISQSSRSWLIADKDNHQGKKDHKDHKDYKDYKDHGDDENDRVVQVDLSRAKNLARQAAEAANGGIRLYRAEDAMHGPAKLCPYVDNGDSWTFTFLGSRVGSTTMTIESVVTVYKSSSRVVVAYNGAIRNTSRIQVVSLTSNQRTVLMDMLRGSSNCGCSHLISSALRNDILGQVRSLPPGIQKQLLRGKGLPPGIAKKLIALPKQVNTYINLPTSYDLFVVGSNVVLFNQVDAIVVDLISNVL